MCRGITCIVLTVFNIALLLGGLAMLIAGSLLKYNKQLLKTLLDKALTSAGGSLPQDAPETLDKALSVIEEMAEPIGNVLFIAGIVVCVLAGVAFLGLCCNIRLLLIIYTVVVGVILAANALLVIIYFANKEVLMKYVEKEFVKLMKEYKSISSRDAESLALGIIMPAMECCGYNGGEDFLQGSDFTHKDEVGGQVISNLRYPLPCCKPLKVGTGPTQCPTVFDNQTSNVNVGCKEHIIPLVNKLMIFFIVTAVVAAVLMALLIIHLCCSK